MFDIVLPQENEKEIIKKLARLNYDKVVFLYKVDKVSDLEIFREKYKEFRDSKISVFLGVLIENANFKKTLKIMAEAFYNKDLFIDLVFVRAFDFDYNRKVINKYFYNGIVNPGVYPTEDHLHFRYIAIPTKHIKKIKENNICVVLGIREIIQNYKYLGRIIHLVKILQKKKVKIIIGSFAKKPEEIKPKLFLISFKKIIGLKYKNKLVFEDFILEQIRRTHMAKNPYVFRKGFMIVRTPYEDYE